MSEGEFEAANSRCKRVKTRGGEGGGRRAAGWLAGVDRTRKKERKKVGKSEDGTGRREGPYLNDIVAGVHTRRLPLIAPLKRPCYLAGGTTEREDPPSRIARVCVYICIHTRWRNVHARERRTECRRKGMRARGGPRGVWIERGRLYRGAMEGEGWKEVNRRCSREEEDEGSRGGARGRGRARGTGAG